MRAIRSTAGILAALAGTLPIFAPLQLEPPPGSPTRAATAHPAPGPEAAAFERARDYAAARGGRVSFAVLDGEGRLRGLSMRTLYPAASVVKAMVLAAELRRLAAAGAPVDDGTGSLLRAMITLSDNDAADAIYARVGDAGMLDVARRVGMRRFEIAGHWGTAQVTAADMARLFAGLDRALPARHREYGKGLLGSVADSQSWGIPVAASPDWAARFKGGWLPEKALVHQAAELRERGGPRRLALAILTDEQPSHAFGVATVEGVAERLLSGP